MLLALCTVSLVSAALANPMPFSPTAAPLYPPGEAVYARAAVTTTFPTPVSSTSLPTPIVVPSGTTFDGKMWRYDRGPGACKGQTELDDDAAVFLVQRGATLKNVIIGGDQAEGVHCLGPCTIQNVWWENVCEDALTIKLDVPGDISYVIGGGAQHAADKVLQHNGCGHLDVRDFFAYDWGKVYRSCGDCSTMCRRTATFNNVIAIAGRDMFCGVNESYDDVCTVANITTNVEDICNESGFDGVVCVSAGPIISTKLTTTTKETTTKTTKTSTTKTTTTKTSTTTTASIARRTAGF